MSLQELHTCIMNNGNNQPSQEEVGIAFGESSFWQLNTRRKKNCCGTDLHFPTADFNFKQSLMREKKNTFFN